MIMSVNFTLNSAKDNSDKALVALIDRAKKAGYTSFGELLREIEPEAEDGKIYKFSLDCDL